MKHSDRLTKQQRKQHKQARQLRQCSRGKAWQETNEQDNSTGNKWERIA